MVKTNKILVVIVGLIFLASAFGGVIQSSASPGVTPIRLLLPREGQVVNKDACLTIVTERLSNVFGTGPAKITVTIEMTGRGAEVVARGSVNVYLAERPS